MINSCMFLSNVVSYFRSFIRLENARTLRAARETKNGRRSLEKIRSVKQKGPSCRCRAQRGTREGKGELVPLSDVTRRIRSSH